MIKLRKFHITQFPEDRIFILLEKRFHKRIFDYINTNYKFRDLNITLFNNKLNKHTYKTWRYRIKKPNAKLPKFIPLWFINKIPMISKNKYKLERIENKIMAYKGPSSSSIIWKPKLPLKENSKLLKILAHVLGDGHIGGAFGTKLSKGKSNSQYRNFNNDLLNSFERDLQVFGRVKTSKNYEHGHVLFPNLIGYIIEYVYKIKTNTFVSRLPKDLYLLNKKVLSSFLRAFFDDEGHVYDNHTELYSCNKNLILDIKKLIIKRFRNLKISKLRVNKSSKNPKYYFYILSESRETFLREIGFDSPEKRKDMIFNIKRVKLPKYGRKTKLNIIRLLKNKDMCAKEISRKLYISHDSILFHLNNLFKKNKVNIISKGKHNENIWKLNNDLKLHAS